MSDSTQNTEQSTVRADRVTQHRTTITTSRVTVRVRVPVPRVKLPPADDGVKHKVRMHILCTLLGALLVGACDVIFGAMFVLHWGAFVQTGPNLTMEYLDRVHNR